MCHTPEDARRERSWHNISEQKSTYLQMAASDALLPSFPPLPVVRYLCAKLQTPTGVVRCWRENGDVIPGHKPSSCSTHLGAAPRGSARRRRSRPRGALPSSPHWRTASRQSRSPDRKPVLSCPPRRRWCSPRWQTLQAEPWPRNQFGKPGRGTRTSAGCQG